MSNNSNRYFSHSLLTPAQTTDLLTRLSKANGMIDHFTELHNDEATRAWVQVASALERRLLNEADRLTEYANLTPTSRPARSCRALAHQLKQAISNA